MSPFDEHTAARLAERHGHIGLALLEVAHILGRNRARVLDVTADELEHEVRRLVARQVTRRDHPHDDELPDTAARIARSTFDRQRAHVARHLEHT